MITAFNTFSETKLYIPCPNCRTPYEIGLPAFVVAINQESLHQCVDCKETFMLELRCLTRDAQLQNGADDAGHTCPSCFGTGRYPVGRNTTFCAMCNGTGQV